MKDEPRDLAAVGALLRRAAAADAEAGIRPFLADRLMRRIAAESPARVRQEDLWQGLILIFRPVAAACLLLVFALAAHNVYIANQFDVPVSPVEAVLGLPEVNIFTAYELDLQAYPALDDPDSQDPTVLPEEVPGDR